MTKTPLDEIMPLFCEHNRCRRDGKKLTWPTCKVKSRCDSVDEAKFIHEHFVMRSEIEKRTEELNEDHSRIWISIFVDMLEKGYFPGKPDWDVSNSSTKNIEEYCEWFTNEMTKSAESQESIYARLRGIWKITYELQKLRDEQ